MRIISEILKASILALIFYYIWNLEENIFLENMDLLSAIFGFESRSKSFYIVGYFLSIVIGNIALSLAVSRMWSKLARDVSRPPEHLVHVIGAFEKAAYTTLCLTVDNTTTAIAITAWLSFKAAQSWARDKKNPTLHYVFVLGNLLSVACGVISAVVIEKLLIGDFVFAQNLVLAFLACTFLMWICFWGR